MFFTDKLNTFHVMSDIELDACLSLENQVYIDKFNEGYQRGLTWPEHWKSHGAPGGPYVYSGKDKEKHKRSQFENDLWRMGYKEGRKLNP